DEAAGMDRPRTSRIRRGGGRFGGGTLHEGLGGERERRRQFRRYRGVCSIGAAASPRPSFAATLGLYLTSLESGFAHAFEHVFAIEHVFAVAAAPDPRPHRRLPGPPYPPRPGSAPGAARPLPP